MGRKSISGGVVPAGAARIQLDFRIEGRRFRPTLPWVPTEANLKRARSILARIKAQILAGAFCFEAEFPRYKGLSRLVPPHRARTCGEVFDAFLRHEEARLARGDLAAVTVAFHRKILDHVWRPYLGHLCDRRARASHRGPRTVQGTRAATPHPKHASARLLSESGRPLVLPPAFSFRAAGRDEVMDLLLVPWQHSGYATRLFFARAISERGQNWKEQYMLEGNWWTPSWNGVAASLPWREILCAHIRGVA